MGIIAGVNTYAVAISSAISSSAPSGDIIYFLAKKVGGNTAFTQKITSIANGYSRADKLGKREIKVTISEALVLAKVESTVAAEYNAMVLKFLNWHKMSANPIYLFVKNISANAYLTLSITSAYAAQGWLKGVIRTFDWEYEKGNQIMIKSIQFQEAIN